MELACNIIFNGFLILFFKIYNALSYHSGFKINLFVYD